MQEIPDDLVVPGIVCVGAQPGERRGQVPDLARPLVLPVTFPSLSRSIMPPRHMASFLQTADMETRPTVRRDMEQSRAAFHSCRPGRPHMYDRPQSGTRSSRKAYMNAVSL
jgi:hypothetical protein